jgi:hypothetical protein
LTFRFLDQIKRHTPNPVIVFAPTGIYAVGVESTCFWGAAQSAAKSAKNTKRRSLRSTYIAYHRYFAVRGPICTPYVHVVHILTTEANMKPVICEEPLSLLERLRTSSRPREAGRIGCTTVEEARSALFFVLSAVDDRLLYFSVLHDRLPVCLSIVSMLTI